MKPNFSSLSINEIFARNIKACREAKGLTQKELAEEILGYPEEFLYKAECGLPCECGIRFYIDLAKEFNVSLEALTNRYFSLHEHNIVKISNSIPLTIKELRQMEGEIVYITPLNDWAKIMPYGLLYFGTEKNSLWQDIIDNYGDKWLAYTQKPKEREN